MSLTQISLSDSEVSGFWQPDKLDMKKAAAVIFGEMADEWPAEFSLLEISGLPPELADILRSSGMHVLWNSSGAEWGPCSLVLVTPQYDSERLKEGLLLAQAIECDIPPPNADAIANEADDGHAMEDGNLDAGVQGIPIPVLPQDDINPEGGDEDAIQFPIASERRRATPLMIAAALGDDDALRLLLNNGADPNLRAPDGTTALMIAAREGHIRVVRSLIHHRKIQTNLTNRSNRDALAYAAEHGHFGVFSLLLNFGGAILPQQVAPEMDAHPLLLAARNGHHAICKLIVDTGIDVNLKDNDERTPLWYAAKSGHVECCLQLLNAGANVNHVDALGEPIVFAAAICGNLELFNLLLKRGAILNGKQKSDTLLNVVTRLGHEHLVRRLIDLKVDINATGGNGQTALTLACMANSATTAKILLEAGANPDIADSIKRNALVYAAGAGNTELMRLLIQHGAKLRSKGNFGYLALYQATISGHLEAMKFLLEANVPTSAPRLMSDTSLRPFPLLSLPMHWAWGDEKPHALDEAIKLLLEHGTPYTEVDGRGYDVLMTAVMGRHDSLIPLLFFAGATVMQAGPGGRNALQLAVFMVDEALADAAGVTPHSTRMAIATLWQMVRYTMHTPGWQQLRAAAVNMAKHPVTREILCHAPVPDTPLASPAFAVAPLPFNGTHVLAILKEAVESSPDDWDRTETEIQLCLAGARLPAIKAFCSYIEAFPAMKLKLFGPVPATKIPFRPWLMSVVGITANMKRLIVDGQLIDDLYEDLEWNETRNTLVGVAGMQISAMSDSATEEESSLATEFAGLFDQCLVSTLSVKNEQMLQLHTSPPSQFIASRLMDKGIYAALADRIDQAWRAAWIDTFPPPPGSSIGSQAAWMENHAFHINEYIPILDIMDPVNTPDGTTHTLSEQQSLQLLQAFRRMLSSIVDSADTLKLPDASPEAAGLYADLMHRQLHMLVQFIRGEVEAEPAPVAAPAPAGAPAADYPTDIWDSNMFEGWPWNEDGS